MSLPRGRLPSVRALLPDFEPRPLLASRRPKAPRFFPTVVRAQPLLLMAVLGSRAARIAEGVLAACDIDSREFAILDLLDRANGPMPQVAIADRLGRDRTTVMQLTRSLGRKGLVTPVRDDDGRVRSVVLSPDGRDVCSLAWNNLLAGAEDLFVRLSEPEAESLTGTLLRIL
jgi:DNA-binding MarR family transcriptional regulator